MAETSPSRMRRIVEDIPLLSGVFRGVAALFLGILLIFMPEKSFPLLGNLMGGFWLSSGLVLLHKDADRAFKVLGRRTTQIAGLVAIVSGLLVVLRRFLEGWIDQGLVVQMLGLVIFLTGILHMWGEIRISRFRISRLTWGHFVLGIFETILGIMLLLSPLSFGWPVYLAATIWAFVGGVTITVSAVYDHLQTRKENEEEE